MDAKLNVIKAWDKLEGDKHYSPKEIEKWLIKDLGPAIKELRTYASHMPSDEDYKLHYCEDCVQMTNHICLKCKTKQSLK